MGSSDVCGLTMPQSMGFLNLGSTAQMGGFIFRPSLAILVVLVSSCAKRNNEIVVDSGDYWSLKKTFWHGKHFDIF